MLTYYQPFLFPFLRFSRYALRRDIAQTYFHSFEDALWVVLRTKRIPMGSVVAVPDFYCMDVVENIRMHRFVPVMYPLDADFQISGRAFRTFVRLHNPTVIILFHACGITNRLLTEPAYIQALCARALVIEDGVHRLVDPSKVVLLHTNHILIDSLRKVSPLPGSFVYSRETIRSPALPFREQEFSYVFQTRILYGAFRFVNVIGVLFRSYRLISFAHKRLLKSHDDRIGDSMHGYTGGIINRYMHRHMDFSRLEAHKKRQVEIYDRSLQNIYGCRSSWYRIAIPKVGVPSLHVYPVGFLRGRGMSVAEIEARLDSLRIPVWFKFPDAPWSRTRSVLFLPLGYHVTDTDILRICRVLTESVT